jgi:hypothetical protein
VAARNQIKAKVREMMNAKVVVTYTSYLDGNEIGDLTCDRFGSFFELVEHIHACRELVPMQLKHDAIYRDVFEARIKVFYNGAFLACENFRREGDGVKAWHTSGNSTASVVNFF